MPRDELIERFRSIELAASEAARLAASDHDEESWHAGRADGAQQCVDVLIELPEERLTDLRAVLARLGCDVAAESVACGGDDVSHFAGIAAGIEECILAAATLGDVLPRVAITAAARHAYLRAADRAARDFAKRKIPPDAIGVELGHVEGDVLVISVPADGTLWEIHRMRCGEWRWTS